MEQTKKKWQFLDGTTMKLVAALLMLSSHIHQMYAWEGAPLWLDKIARPVFPMFLFLAAESFHYTRDRKKYLKRLLLASWGMTLLTYTVQRVLPNPNAVLMNNAFSTFFVAVLYMQFWDWFVEGIKEKKAGKVVKALLCCLIPVLCAAPLLLLTTLTMKMVLPGGLVRFIVMLTLLIPNIMTAEGGIAMVALGVFFYIFRKHRVLQVLILLLLSGVSYRIDGGYQWLMCAAALPMLLYNGEKGRGMKNFFYVFYPAHIVILYLIATLF